MTQSANTKGMLRGDAGAKRRGQLVKRQKDPPNPQTEKQKASHGTPEKTLPDNGRITGHNDIMDSNGQAYPLDDSHPIKEGGMK